MIYFVKPSFLTVSPQAFHYSSFCFLYFGSFPLAEPLSVLSSPAILKLRLCLYQEDSKTLKKVILGQGKPVIIILQS